jgi:hypothetical protein
MWFMLHSLPSTRTGRKESTKMRRRIPVFAVIGATLAALAVGSIGVLSASAQADQITICHRTNSDDNPYVVNHPANEGVLNGHFTQHNELVIWEPGLKDNGIMWGDIIPPFNGNQGLNWTAEGQAIFNNGCVPPGFVPPTAPPETKPPETAPKAPAAPSAPRPVAGVPRLTG